MTGFVWPGSVVECTNQYRSVLCIQEFIQYFEDTWLVGNYPLTMWNVYWSDSFRANNHLEGWHNRLKWLVAKGYPNVYEFVEVIQKKQTMFVLQLEAEAHPPPKSLKQR